MQDKIMPDHRKDPINWPMSLFIISIHVGAALALFNFSWPALGVTVLLYWVTCNLGMTIGYHRLLTHRAFNTPKFIEYFLTLCGALSFFGGPIVFVARHRYHHANADCDRDPHSPRHGVWWSYLGWVLTSESDHRQVDTWARYARDLAKDRFHLWISQWFFLPQLFLTLILFWAGGWQFVLWGVCLRVVLVWHLGFLSGTIGHLWGSRRFETPDDSRNNWWVALITCGEGWHNNHHAHPASARHGLAWYEVDFGWYAIWIMKQFGLVKKVRLAKLPEKSAESEAKEARKEAARWEFRRSLARTL